MKRYTKATFPTKNFQRIHSYPGTHGNPFDVMLSKWEKIESIPSIIFFSLLVGWSWILAGGWLPHVPVIGSFFTVDWLLLSLLPKFKVSYGPAKPTAALLLLLRSPFYLLPYFWSLGFQILGTLLVIYAFYIEPQLITISHREITTSLLPAHCVFSIMHIGDLHVERITPRENKLQFLIKQTKPDLILFSGDFLNLSYLRELTAQDHVRHVISQWIAPLGAYAVTGSPAVDLSDVVPELIRNSPLININNRTLTVTKEKCHISVTGIECTHNPEVDKTKLVQQNEKGEFSILLYHSPDLAPQAAEAGYNLMLSGHTHGGQVRLPLIGALFTGSIYGKCFEAGEYQFDDMRLYITRGLGMEGKGAPRVRFLCPPEIIIWNIRGQTH